MKENRYEKRRCSKVYASTSEEELQVCVCVGVHPLPPSQKRIQRARSALCFIRRCTASSPRYSTRHGPSTDKETQDGAQRTAPAVFSCSEPPSRCQGQVCHSCAHVITCCEQLGGGAVRAAKEPLGTIPPSPSLSFVSLRPSLTPLARNPSTLLK